MSTLYDRLAEDYLGEAVDAYYSLDDTFTLPEIEVRPESQPCDASL